MLLIPLCNAFKRYNLLLSLFKISYSFQHSKLFMNGYHNTIPMNHPYQIQKRFTIIFQTLTVHTPEHIIPHDDRNAGVFSFDVSDHIFYVTEKKLSCRQILCIHACFTHITTSNMIHLQ